MTTLPSAIQNPNPQSQFTQLSLQMSQLEIQPSREQPFLLTSEEEEREEVRKRLASFEITGLKRIPSLDGSQKSIFFAEQRGRPIVLAVTFWDERPSGEKRSEESQKRTMTIARNEVEAGKLLRGCPHVAQIELAFETSYGMYLVMPRYLEGDLCSLTEAFQSNPQLLTLAQRVLICCDSAFGLLEIHKKGILHRDIKAENILLGKDQRGNYRAHLTDFGYVCRTNDERERKIVRGTDYMMAPEVHRGEGASEQSDNWSLAVTLFCFMTLRGLFHVNNKIKGQQLKKVIGSLEETWKPSFNVTISSDSKIDNAIKEIFRKVLVVPPLQRVNTLVHYEMWRGLWEHISNPSA